MRNINGGSQERTADPRQYRDGYDHCYNRRRASGQCSGEKCRDSARERAGEHHRKPANIVRQTPEPWLQHGTSQ